MCSDFRRFVSPAGVPGFVTGELGMGHTVLPAANFEETWAFLRDVMGFGLSDIHRFRPAPDAPAIPIYFLHCNNGRHHSLALFGAPVASGCVHLMVEVENLVEVGRAHDRMQRKGVKLMATLGQHVNDRMTSFYMDTPSGFAIEYGFGGLVLDWTRHSVYEASEVSVWGHDFGVGFNAPSN
ncbi:Iron-dependent extradiol dioxygenase [compost metagenome]